MIHMNEALIVEGRYDKSKLSALTDAIIVTTKMCIRDRHRGTP